MKHELGASSDFQLVYVEHFAAVAAFFRRRGYVREVARELAQDTFVRAFSGWPDFRGEAAVKTWLLRIAVNVWRNELRARHAKKRDGPSVTFDELNEGETMGATGPEEQLWERQRRELVLAALGSLPARMRCCVVLYLSQDLKYREIAAAMNISIGAVKSQLHEARLKLKSQLEGHITGPDG